MKITIEFDETKDLMTLVSANEETTAYRKAMEELRLERETFKEIYSLKKSALWVAMDEMQQERAIEEIRRKQMLRNDGGTK